MEEVVLQTQWGVLVALYLFLGGLAAGTLCVSAVINLKTKDKFKNTIRFGSWAGTILLIVGVLCLVAETSMPLRAMMLWQSFTNPQSWMTIGAWLLVAGIVISGLYALSNTKWVTDRLQFLKKIKFGLAVLVVPVSLGIALYTGILLGVLVSHPLWNTWLLPVLFTVSALDTGVALVLGYVTLFESKKKAPLEEAKTDSEEQGVINGGEATAEEKESTQKLTLIMEKSTIILIVLEIIVLAVYLATVSSAGDVATASVELLTTGALSMYFWILFVALGLVIPLVISVLLVVKHDLAARIKDALPLMGIVLCLVGGCALRFLILLAGLPVYA